MGILKYKNFVVKIKDLKYNLKAMWKRIVIILLVALKVEVTSGQRTVVINQNSVYLDIGAIQRVKLLINEIMFSDSHDWVEVYCVDDGNLGNGTQIKGFYFKNSPDPTKKKIKIIGTCTIRTGEFLLLNYGLAGEDDSFGIGGRINLFINKRNLISTSEQMVLYNSLDEIIDAVCWVNDTPPAYEEEDRNRLIEVGKWQGEGIDSIKVSDGQSIARNGLLDTNSKNDWYVTSVPTPGLPNKESSQPASPQINVVKIINKTFAPENGEKTTIIYSLSNPSQVSLRIYDIRGRLVKRLIEQEYKIAKEENIVSWDGRDEAGNFLPIGVYICYLEAVDSVGASSDKVTLILAKKL